MQEYEMMILYVPLLLDDIKKNTTSKIEKFVKSKKGTLEEVKGEVGNTKKLLAYPIRKYEEGHYIEYKLKMDPSDISELERLIKLQQDVLRHLIIKK